MLKRVLAGLMAAAFVAVLLPATANAQGMKDMKKPEYKNATIRGTVIDGTRCSRNTRSRRSKSPARSFKPGAQTRFRSRK